ncbi:MAG TPA: hypothetical protein VF060_16135 [Trebonia sp.]
MDHQDPSPRQRLPGPGEPGPDEARAASRDRGIRHVRRLSNWTAAALIAATAITAGYFAHAGAGAPRPAAVAGAQSQAPGSHQPCVTAPVATSGGSGVTTATVPSSCATGPNGTSSPVVSAPSYEGRGDQ